MGEKRKRDRTQRGDILERTYNTEKKKVTKEPIFSSKTSVIVFLQISLL